MSNFPIRRPCTLYPQRRPAVPVALFFALYFLRVWCGSHHQIHIVLFIFITSFVTCFLCARLAVAYKFCSLINVYILKPACLSYCVMACAFVHRSISEQRLLILSILFLYYFLSPFCKWVDRCPETRASHSPRSIIVMSLRFYLSLPRVSRSLRSPIISGMASSPFPVSNFFSSILLRSRCVSTLRTSFVPASIVFSRIANHISNLD